MHSLIVGQTGSGKSYLARKIAGGLHKAGKSVAVLDPIGYDWPCDFQTHNPDKFLAYARTTTNGFLFIDESGEALRLLSDDSNARDIFWLTTRGRHLGHSVFLIGQRITQIPVTMRDMCEVAYVFVSSAKDGATLADEFNKPILTTANSLRKGEFYRVNRYGLCQKGTIDFKRSRFTLVVHGEDNVADDSSGGDLDRAGNDESQRPTRQRGKSLGEN